MLSDKEIKKEFKLKASKNPEKYYAVDFLTSKGYHKKKCIGCGTYFWSTDTGRRICGDSNCIGKFEFLEKKFCSSNLNYLGVWKEFSKMFKKFGYTPIHRYPLVSRWNPTMDFTIASIAAFQPYVVSGEVKPPANPLVIPQFCLRFGDIDNVGITGSHMTGFVMMGQHEFVEPKDWNQEKVFNHIYLWLKQGLKIKDKNIIFHEEAWAGGGNYGPCMEFFSGGLELGNQVYMLYGPGNKELKIKVLDMGAGQERCAWFSQRTPTIYDATYPNICKKLFEKTGLNLNTELMKKFTPYSGMLNIDETKDLSKTWKNIGKKIGIEVEELKKEILPLSGVYSIAEHARSLLVALNDGGLPSNSGGGYNLRVLIRRVFGFINKYGWNIDLSEICELHAKYLQKQYPELIENLEEVKKILVVEKNKYKASRQKSEQIVSKAIKETINTNKLVEFYDSHGVDPEILREEALKVGKEINIPDNFYSLVASKHENIHKEEEKRAEIDLKNVPDTVALYFDDYKKDEFHARILKIIGNNVILDKTVFYPTSGGQDHDNGKINGIDVIDVFKQGGVIVHELEKIDSLKVGGEVKGKIDLKRRIQLSQHHTSAHIINAAARKVLGNHINQSGAKKSFEKAHLDITHYQSLSEEEVEKIENEANKLIERKIKVESEFVDRDVAEKKYGMRIYQGGAVPGKKLRIINIHGIDVECCGGTHLLNTSETRLIKIIRSVKISDAVVRIEYKAGEAALEEISKEKKVLRELSKILDCEINEIPGRAEELFTKWKDKVKKGKQVEVNLKSHIKFKGDIVLETARIFKTQPEHLVKTARRFKEELEKK